MSLSAEDGSALADDAAIAQQQEAVHVERDVEQRESFVSEGSPDRYAQHSRGRFGCLDALRDAECRSGLEEPDRAALRLAERQLGVLEIGSFPGGAWIESDPVNGEERAVVPDRTDDGWAIGGQWPCPERGVRMETQLVPGTDQTALQHVALTKCAVQ